MWARRLATATRPSYNIKTKAMPAFRPMNNQWRGMASAASNQVVENIPITTITEDTEANGEFISFIFHTNNNSNTTT